MVPAFLSELLAVLPVLPVGFSIADGQQTLSDRAGDLKDRLACGRNKGTGGRIPLIGRRRNRDHARNGDKQSGGAVVGVARVQRKGRTVQSDRQVS